MRKLKVVIARTRDGAPALVLATLLPVGAMSCGSDVSVRDGDTASGTGGASTTTSQGAGGTGTGTGTGVGTGGTRPVDAGADAGLCGPYEWEDTFVVDVPPEGVPADPGQLCNAPQSPAESNRAAFVTLNRYSQSLHLATGAVEVDSDVLAEVTGTPIIEVSSALYGPLAGMQVSNVQSAATGYTFDAEWPTPFNAEPNDWARMTVRVTLRLSCPTGPPKLVESHTDIHLCTDFDGPMWVSSGDTCTTCSQICEMAPSPAATDCAEDDLALAQALSVTLRQAACAGRSQVLIAEHDGGEGLRYRWEASEGELRQVAPDIVVWTPAAGLGPHNLSVAVTGADRVGIASVASA
jgi:hypothetical protein